MELACSGCRDHLKLDRNSPMDKTKRKRLKRQASSGSLRKELHVGDIVRRLRKSRQLSVRMLADKCGFSPSFISQVELRQASPSIASTERIAAALGVSLGEFFHISDPSQPTVIRADARPVVQSEWSRAKIEAIGPISGDSQLEPMVITMEPGGASGSRPYVRQAEQVAVVLQGTVELTFEEAVHDLKRGDATCIPAGSSHCWRNTSRKPAHILIVTVRGLR
ncbi:MAG: putative HTH-type transcriptional regulator [Nitrospira sp.]|nr:putative HTH-type transcriptional regulator [Nitrospira sp.]